MKSSTRYLVGVGLFLTLFVVFQNCSPSNRLTGSDAKPSTSLQTSEPGDNNGIPYNGIRSYVLISSNCSATVGIEKQINVEFVGGTPSTATLVRDACSAVLQSVNISSIAFSDRYITLIYNNTVLTDQLSATSEANPPDYSLFRGVYNTIHLSYTDYYYVSGGFSMDTASGFLNLNGLSVATLFRAGLGYSPGNIVPGVYDASPFTLETRLKLYSDSEDDGLIQEFTDSTGSAILSFSPNRISYLPTTTGSGRLDFNVNLTDRLHTIRVVRTCSPVCGKISIYLDNAPVPVLSAGTMGNLTTTSSRLSFGDLAYPTVAPRPHALIEYIRWHGQAIAPQ